VDLVRTDVSEKRIASIIRVKRINELRLQQLLTANVHKYLIIFTLMTEEIRFCETSALTSATRRHIREDGFPLRQNRENLKSYRVLTERRDVSL
jgi:UDP-glucose 6-dehydrogenase